jgi:hypothetical protein
MLHIILNILLLLVVERAVWGVRTVRLLVVLAVTAPQLQENLLVVEQLLKPR